MYWVFLRMRTQIHTGVNLHMCKLTPGFDQMSMYFNFYIRMYFKIFCHANAKLIYLCVFLFLVLMFDAESAFRL